MSTNVRYYLAQTYRCGLLDGLNEAVAAGVASTDTCVQLSEDLTYMITSVFPFVKPTLNVSKDIIQGGVTSKVHVLLY